MDTAQEVSQELATEFVQAAHSDRNFPKLKTLLAAHPALLNAKWEQFDETALQASSHMGQRHNAIHLLSEGAPLDICAAAMLGMTHEVARFLREDPSQANARGAHGISLMYHAAQSGKTELMDLILAHGGRDGIDAALHAAIRFGHAGMVKWLLVNGVQNVNVPNFEGKTPLKVAVEGGHEEIARLLRERGGTE